MANYCMCGLNNNKRVSQCIILGLSEDWGRKMMTSDKKSYRYKAFISYNHQDAKFAKFLHTRLENYSSHESGPNIVKKPLFPIFLDESELTAGSTLSDAIKDAIGASEFLIVICSQNSVSSKWVREEIAWMRKLHDTPRIIGVIPKTNGDETHLNALFEQGSEHLAADFRTRNNKHLQLSKIAATLMRLDLDILYKRETRRKNKQITFMGTTLSTIAGIMTLLAANAYSSEKEAVRQRQQSEDVIAFMIDDFRDDLERLDKLDMLADVGQKAQDYFEDRDINLLSDESVILQSRTLRQLSDVDIMRGKLASSKDRVASAYSASKLMMSRRPNQNDAIQEHGDNAAHWAYVEYQLGDLEIAKTLALEAMTLYEKGINLFPEDEDFAWKRATAEQTVGVMILQSGKANEAKPYLERTLLAIGEENQRRDLTEEQLYEYVDSYTWYIRSLPDTTPLSFLYSTRQNQLELLEKVGDAGVRTIRNQGQILNVERAVVPLLLNMGRDDEAEALMLSIQARFEKLLEYDEENVGWRRHLMRSKLSLARLRHKTGQASERNRLLKDVMILWKKTDGTRWQATTDIVMGVDCLNAYRLFDEESLAASITDLERAEKEIRDFRQDNLRPRDKYNIANLNSVKAELLLREGRITEAKDTQLYVLNLLSSKDSFNITEQKMKLRAYHDLNMLVQEKSLETKLRDRGMVLN